MTDVPRTPERRPPEATPARRGHPVLRFFGLIVCLGVGANLAAPLIASRDGARWYEGEEELVLGLASAVEARTSGRLVATKAFETGSERFDGEWVFGTYFAAALGFGQVALEHPSLRARMRPAMETCLDRLLDERVRSFDSDAWHEDALETLENADGHAAYLGYLGVVLGLHRRVYPDSRFADVHERITNALRRRLAASPSGLIETYPNEAYAVDTASALVAVSLADDASGRPRSTTNAFHAFERYVDPATGLLIQAADPETGVPADAPRGSGTALAAHMLAFVDLTWSRRLNAAVERSLARRVLGFGVVDEFPRGARAHTDIDSGPVVFGAGVSATGFSLATARIFGARERFEHTYATAHLFGAPLGTDTREGFTSGGPIGDAILFAALTAPREATLRAGNGGVHR